MTFEKAGWVQEIAEGLIAKHGMSLRDAHIEYYERTRTRDSVAEPPRQQDANNPGKASVRNPRDQKVLKGHFVIEVNGNWCEKATPEQREALVYHLLCHCWFTDGKPKIVQHDFQGFTSEVRHYGPWSKDLAEFDAALKQKTLPLEPAAAEVTEPPATVEDAQAEPEPTRSEGGTVVAPTPVAGTINLQLVGDRDTLPEGADNRDPFEDTGE